mgnify:CR=1 FL=1
MNTTHTWHEITSQPEVWRNTLEAFLRDRDRLERFLGSREFGPLFATGCGSTHYLAMSAAAGLTLSAGRHARAFPSSELVFFPRLIPSSPTMLLAISRSGTTTETLWALDTFRKANPGPVVAVTCYPDSPLARGADWVLSAQAAQEESIAQTRSFASMLLLAQAFAAVLAADERALAQLQRLPQLLGELVARYGDVAEALGRDLGIERLFYLGNGPLYGLACEGMLKMKEMSLSVAEAYHFLEFRHGPMSMVNERTLVVGLVSQVAGEHEVRVLQHMERLGAQVLALVEDRAALGEWRPAHLVEVGSGLGDWPRGLLCLPLLQRLAYHRSVAKGLNPDRPHNLTAVVEL